MRPRAPRAVLVAALALAALVAAVMVVVWTVGPRRSETAAVTQVVTSPSPAVTGSTAGPSVTSAPPVPSATPATRAPKPARGAGRLITVVNRTGQTVWLAATRNQSHPLAATGWVLRTGGSVTIAVPNQWGGRFWGRTGCTFNPSGHGHCRTGDCGGAFQCTGSGVVPATLAELTLDAWPGLDFYDVSMVDGANLPMYINVSHTSTKDPVSANGCVPAGCTRPVNCPAALRVGTSP